MTTAAETKPAPLSPRPAHKRFKDFPEHAKLAARIAELKTRLNDVEIKLRPFFKATANPPGGDLARRLVDADSLPARLADANPDEAEADRLRKERRLLHDALKMAEDELRLLESRLGRRCCEPLAAWHRRLVAEMGRKAVELVLLARQEEAALGALREDGITPRLCDHGGHASPGFLGSLRSSGTEPGAVRAWLDLMIEQQLLTGHEDWLAAFLTSEPEPRPITPPVRPEPGPARPGEAHRRVMRSIFGSGGW